MSSDNETAEYDPAFDAFSDAVWASLEEFCEQDELAVANDEISMSIGEAFDRDEVVDADRLATRIAENLSLG